MKKLMMYLGKYFCLMLGIFLFASSVPAFGQKITQGIEQFRSPVSIGGMENAREAFINEVTGMRELLEGCNAFGYPDPFDLYYGGVDKLDKMLSSYEALIKEEDKILSYTRSLDVADKEATDIIAYRYLTGDSQQALKALRLEDQFFFNKLNTLLEFVVNEYSPVNSDLVNFLGADKVKEFKNCLKYFEERFNKGFYNNLEQNIELYNKEIYPKMTEWFRQAVKPCDVLETAFKQMTEEQKTALKLSFQARDAKISTKELAESIIKYIKNFDKELTNPKYYSKEGLIVTLRNMNLTERAKYTDAVTRLNSGSQNFIEDYKQLNSVEKRVFRKSIKGFWVLAGLGVIATAAYITDVAADNHFNSGYTMSNRELATIGKKIENGTANVKEKFAFFTSSVAEQYVQKDPVYTLNLVDLVEGVYAANELLNAQKAQGQQIKDNVENGVLKNLNKQMNTTDFGVGSL